MDDVIRIIENYGNSVKNWFLNVWDSFYSYLVSAVGENGAKMIVILGSVILVYVVFFKFANRD